MINDLIKQRGLIEIWDKKIDWEIRRGEIVDLLCREEYGFMPEEEQNISFQTVDTNHKFCASKSVLEKVIITSEFKNGKFSFPVYASIPKGVGPFPLFVFINFSSDVPDRYLPSEEICDHSCAVISFNYKDVSADDFTNPNDGEKDLYNVLFRNNQSNVEPCGKIRLWAWAASKVLDYAYTLERIDFDKTAVVGHSRLGKTALLAGAIDERFKYVFSNDSGCSGSAISRGKIGESVAKILDRFPYWFCDSYKKYAENENAMPFDQHFLVASIAPRKVYVASAVEDEWADPTSEFLSCFAASEVYDKLGLPSLSGVKEIPAPFSRFHQSDIAYHIRFGSHYFSREDWNNFIEYIKK